MRSEMTLEEERKHINNMSYDYMCRFRASDRQHDHVHPWVGARIGWVEGYRAGQSSLNPRLELYERLLKDVLDLPQIIEQTNTYGRDTVGIKTLIREALK